MSGSSAAPLRGPAGLPRRPAAAGRRGRQDRPRRHPAGRQPAVPARSRRRRPGRHRRPVRGSLLDRGGTRPRAQRKTIRPHRSRPRNRLARRRPGPAHPPRHRPHPRPRGRQGDRIRHHQPPGGPRRAPSPGHRRPPALGSGKPSALRPRRHLPRGCAESPNRELARQLRSHPQPGHRRGPQGRIRQHSPRPPLLRVRRPANSRTLRIRLNRHPEYQVTQHKHAGAVYEVLTVLWNARCSETGTPGAGSGPGKRAGR